MAERFSDQTIFKVTPYPVESEEAMIESLRFGHVDLAMMDAASSWMSWKNYDLQVLLADKENYGRTYYNSNAWVKSESEIATYQDDDDPLTDPFSLFEVRKHVTQDGSTLWGCFCQWASYLASDMQMLQVIQTM